MSLSWLFPQDPVSTISNLDLFSTSWKEEYKVHTYRPETELFKILKLNFLILQKIPECKDQNSDAHVYLYSPFTRRLFAGNQSYKLLLWNVLIKFKRVYFILAFFKFEIIYFGHYFPYILFIYAPHFSNLCITISTRYILNIPGLACKDEAQIFKILFLLRLFSLTRNF